jgi:trimethylamine--corrinoid protein Co-methyltransferase
MENLAGSFEILSDDEIKKNHKGSIEILEETGMEIPLKSLLDQLADFGIKVDHQKKRAFFTNEIVKKAIDSSPSTFNWHSRNSEYDIIVGGSRVSCCITTAPSSVLDLDGVRRPATVQDAMNTRHGQVQR